VVVNERERERERESDSQRGLSSSRLSPPLGLYKVILCANFHYFVEREREREVVVKEEEA